jgi:leucyl/phenylalanyl-tRNA--protein transferase
LRRAALRTELQVRTDTAFRAVIEHCAAAPRPGQDGTWITEEIVAGFCALHAAGFAHSIEAWRGTRLVGGLYGISLGRAFFGESMFALEDDVSKIAMLTALGNFKAWGMDFVDCQVHTAHLHRFGVQMWSRARYLAALRTALQGPTRRGRWQFELSPPAALECLRTG